MRYFFQNFYYAYTILIHLSINDFQNFYETKKEILSTGFLKRFHTSRFFRYVQYGVLP